jgi:hypothetical protein
MLVDLVCTAGHWQRDRLCRADLSDAPTTCPEVTKVPSPIDGAGVYQLCGQPLTRALSAPAAFPGAAAWREKK